MNDKGQALIEFVLIAPVFLLIFVALIDIGNIYLKKYELSNNLSVVSEYYENDEKEEMNAFLAKEEIIFNEKNHDSFITLQLEKNVDINAPILSNVIGKKFKITVSKNIYNEGQNG